MDEPTDETRDEMRREPAGEELTMRPARPKDRDAVLAFCARTWPDGDYIAEVWDDWLRETHSVLLVGVLGARPVALAHVKLLSGDEAWLEGVRVDPARRRLGLGRVLISRALVAARERGATVVRLGTDSDNLAAQGLFARFGFERVAALVYYKAPSLAPDAPDGEAGAQSPASDAAAFERIWAWLEQSNLAPLNGGLELLGWKARALTEPRLHAYLAAGEVTLIEAWGTIAALAVARVRTPEGDRPPTLEVRYLDGAAEGIGRLALALRRLAGARGLAGVSLWLPDLLILRDAMDGAGYVHAGPEAFWLYARDL